MLVENTNGNPTKITQVASPQSNSKEDLLDKTGNSSAKAVQGTPARSGSDSRRDSTSSDGKKGTKLVEKKYASLTRRTGDAQGSSFIKIRRRQDTRENGKEDEHSPNQSPRATGVRALLSKSRGNGKGKDET